jgi:hypothetical protein
MTYAISWSVGLDSTPRRSSRLTTRPTDEIPSLERDQLHPSEVAKACQRDALTSSIRILRAGSSPQRRLTFPVPVRRAKWEGLSVTGRRRRRALLMFLRLRAPLTAGRAAAHLRAAPRATVIFCLSDLLLSRSKWHLAPRNVLKFQCVSNAGLSPAPNALHPAQLAVIETCKSTRSAASRPDQAVELLNPARSGMEKYPRHSDCTTDCQSVLRWNSIRRSILLGGAAREDRQASDPGEVESEERPRFAAGHIKLVHLRARERHV